MSLDPRLNQSLSGLVLILTVLLVGCVDYRSCGSPRRRLDFGPLARAERIEVGWVGYDTHVANITDPDKVQAARAFLERHRDGWLSSWTGATIGRRQVVFYPAEGRQGLVVFTFSEDYIATSGMYQRVLPAAITALNTSLGLPWPGK